MPTLSEFWHALSDDVVALEAQLSHQTAKTKIALEMAMHGARISEGMTTAWGHRGKLDAELVKLGSSFLNPVSQKREYLPDITNYEDLQFALVYWQHLERYQQVEEPNGFTGLNWGLQNEKPAVKETASVLKGKILDYCRKNPEDVGKLQSSTHPKAKEVISSLSSINQLAEKLMKRIKANLVAIIEDQELETITLKKICHRIDGDLYEIEMYLRVIAEYQALVELLEKDKVTVEELLNNKIPENIVRAYSDRTIAQWKVFCKRTLANQSHGAVAKTSRNVLHGAVGLVTSIANLGASIVSSTVGRIVPEVVANGFSQLVGTVGRVKDALTPDSYNQHNKQLLIEAAKKQISSTIFLFNRGLQRSNRLLATDFAEISSGEISGLADRVEIARKVMAALQSTELYHKKHNKGLVAFSLWGVFGVISRFMSNTILRPLLYDKVLLKLEVEKLAKELSEVHEATKDKESPLDKEEVTSQLSGMVKSAKDKATGIVENSRYLLFKKSSQAAATELDELLSTVGKILTNSTTTDSTTEQEQSSSPNEATHRQTNTPGR